MYKNDDDFKEIILKKLNYERETVNKFLGYKSRKIPHIIEKKIKEESGKIGHYLDIEKEYKLFKENGEDFAFIIYTVGERVEDLAEDYTNNGEGIRALIIDKLSIVILDLVKEYLIEEIERKTSLYVTAEFYPASKGFPIENQKTILESMTNIKSIKINKFYQFFPIKSVALKVRLEKEAKAYNRCEDCESPCPAMVTSKTYGCKSQLT